MSATTELWWVSVGGNSCEPARVMIEDDGLKTVYTIACGDGTILTPDCGIDLIQEMGRPPLTPRETEKSRLAWERKRARDAKRGIYHGYRKFD